MIKLIGTVFSNGRMLSVSDKYESINEHAHTDQEQNKTTYTMGQPELPMNWQLANWLVTAVHLGQAHHGRRLFTDMFSAT